MPPTKPTTRTVGFAELLDVLGYTPGENVSLLADPPPPDGPAYVVVDATEAADAAAALPDSSNLYYSVNPIGPVTAGRGKAADVTRLSCLWVDLDVKPGGCDSLDIARAIAAEVGMKLGTRPAVTVATGTGLHAYWPVSSGGIRNGDTAALAVLKRFHRLVVGIAGKRNIKVDSVFDLPRMLRVPGSVNHKYGDPLPVEAKLYDGFERLSLAAVERALAAAGIPHIDVDTDPAEVSLPSEWEWAEETCGYAVALSVGLSDDRPSGGRHQWLISQTIRLVCAARLGCITRADYQEALAALRERFNEILADPAIGEPRDVGESEFSDAIRNATAVVSAKSETAVREELGGHAHDDELDSFFISGSATLATPQQSSSEPVTTVAVLRKPRILDQVVKTLRRQGLVGEERLAKTVYLVVTSRLLSKQASAGIKGHSASGKSYTVELVLRLFPEDSYITLSGMSEKALIYSTAEFSHKTLVIYEITALRESSDDDMTSYFVRTLLSEGHIKYDVTEKGQDGRFVTRSIVREGPTNMVFTTTKTSVHAENETRILSLGTDDSPEQTRRVMAALAGEDDRTAGTTDIADWQQAQRWLESDAAAKQATVPYARALAELMPAEAVRMRRDFSSILALVHAHAVLHQLNRDKDDRGRVVATIDDYAIVRELIGGAVSEGVGAAVSDAMRDTVGVVARLSEEQKGGVAVTAIAKALHIDKSNASRRLADAAGKGYVRNLETRPGVPGQWVVDDPLPGREPILPTIEAIEQWTAQHRNTPQPSEQDRCGVASVAEQGTEST